MRRTPGPTARQVYALAAALCEQADEPWPETVQEASELIGRLRRELGHPRPELEDCVPRRRRRGRGLDRALHDELVDELLAFPDRRAERRNDA